MLLCSLWVASADWLQWWAPPPLPRLQMTHMSAFAKVDGGGYQENRSERSLRRRIRGDVRATIEAAQARPSKQPVAQSLPAAAFSQLVLAQTTTNNHSFGNPLAAQTFSLLQILPQRQLVQHVNSGMGRVFELISDIS